LAISSINYLSEKQIIINISSTILYGEKVTLSYDGNNIKDNNDSLLNSISNMEVINNTPVMYYIPAKIEAEKYYQQSGLSVETCNEGGQDMGYTNSGDYLDYLVVINEATMYSITFRIAAQNSGGKLELQLYDDNNNKTTIAIIDIPGTGGWQNWQSVNISSNLPSGFYRLRLYIKNPEFNINWFSIEKSNKALNIDSYNNIKIYPNPCRDYVFIDNLNKLDQKHFVLYDILGQQQQLNFSFFSEQTAKADMTKLKEGIYLMCINTYEKMIIKKIIKTK